MHPVIQSLKNRRVVQWALAYLAGAWVVLQVMDVLGGNLGWPPWIFQVAVALLSVGFLAALVLAWYHGEQGRQRVSGVELVMLAGILLMAGTALTLVRPGTSGSESASGGEAEGLEAAVRPSIDVPSEAHAVAILPLENLSPDPEHAFFADGVHDELIAQLSKIANVGVISRTSVMGYRGTTEDLRTVASELGVTHLVEGTVRRAGNRARITIQLIDGSADEHLWSESYDVALTAENMFALQEDVARRVVISVGAALAPAEEERLSHRPTESFEAYDFYLQANEYRRDPDWRRSRPIAIELYQRAIELDPEFALAYATLSFVHVELYWFGFDPSDRRRELARQSGARALEIDPNLPEAHLARGAYLYRGHRDYEGALNEFEIARGLSPNDADLHHMIGGVLRRQGRFAGALVYFERAAQLDPRNTNLAYDLCQTLQSLRQYERAEDCADRMIAIQPDDFRGYFVKAGTQVDERGDVEEAREILEAAERYLPPQRVWGAQFELDFYAADYERALERLRSNAHPQEMVMGQYHRYPRALDFADAHHFLGNSDSAQVYYEMALPVLESIRQQDPEWYGPDLARVYAGLGRADDVVREGERILSLVPYERDALWNPHLRFEVAANYAIVEEVDRALDQMEFVLSVPNGYASPHRFRLSPFFRSLRGHPRFEALLQEYESVTF